MGDISLKTLLVSPRVLCWIEKKTLGGYDYERASKFSSAMQPSDII